MKSKVLVFVFSLLVFNFAQADQGISSTPLLDAMDNGNTHDMEVSGGQEFADDGARLVLGFRVRPHYPNSKDPITKKIGTPAFFELSGSVAINTDVDLDRDALPWVNLHLMPVSVPSFHKTDSGAVKYAFNVGLLPVDMSRNTDFNLDADVRGRLLRLGAAVSASVLFADAYVDGPGLQYTSRRFPGDETANVSRERWNDSFPKDLHVFVIGGQAAAGLQFGDVNKNKIAVRIPVGFSGRYGEISNHRDTWIEPSLRTKAGGLNATVFFRFGKRKTEYFGEEYNRVYHNEEERYGWILGKLQW